MISGTEVMFGDNSLSTGGFFSGGQVLIVNITKRLWSFSPKLLILRRRERRKVPLDMYFSNRSVAPSGRFELYMMILAGAKCQKIITSTS